MGPPVGPPLPAPRAAWSRVSAEKRPLLEPLLLTGLFKWGEPLPLALPAEVKEVSMPEGRLSLGGLRDGNLRAPKSIGWEEPF